MRQWITNNKEWLSIMIPVVIALTAGAWVVYSKFQAPLTPTLPNSLPIISNGTINTNVGDSYIGNTITINKNDNLVAALEDALDISKQFNSSLKSLVTDKDNQITELQRQLRQNRAVTVSKEAIELANKIPNDSKDSYALSLKAIALGDYDVARNYLNALIKEQESAFELQRDNLAKSYRARVETEYYDNQFNAALVWVNKWVNILSDRTVALFYRGVIYTALEQYPKALADYTQVITLDAKFAMAYYNRGVVYYTLKQYRKALTDYDQVITRNVKFALAYNNRGGVHSILKQYPKALDDYTQAISLDAKFATAYFNRGIVYVTLKQYPKALDDFTQAITFNNNDVTAYINRGTAYVTLRQYLKALDDYTQAISLDAKYAAAYNNRGIVYIILKQYPEALQDFHKANQLDPNNIISVNSLVRLYSTISNASLRNPVKALSLTKKYLVNLENPTYLITAAAAFAENNLFDRAILISKKALKLAKKNKKYEYLIPEIEKHLLSFRNKLPIRD